MHDGTGVQRLKAVRTSSTDPLTLTVIVGGSAFGDGVHSILSQERQDGTEDTRNYVWVGSGLSTGDCVANTIYIAL